MMIIADATRSAKIHAWITCLHEHCTIGARTGEEVILTGEELAVDILIVDLLGNLFELWIEVVIHTNEHLSYAWLLKVQHGLDLILREERMLSIIG